MSPPLPSPHRRPLDSSAGRISAIMLIEAGGTYDLPYFLDWIRLSGVSRGILLLVDIPAYHEDDREILRQIAALGIGIIPVDAHGRSLPLGMPVLPSGASRPASYPVPAVDLMVAFYDHAVSAHSTLYIGTHSRHDYGALRGHPDFRASLASIGIDSMESRDHGHPLIEGGDYLLVGDHLFIGRRTQQQYGAGAEAAICSVYGLSPQLQIHFTGVADPDIRLGLYHLDLYFTYAGRDPDGLHLFLIGYIDGESIGDMVIPSMAAQLEAFAQHIRSLLDTCYTDGYMLIRIPVICCDIYRYSPLNGIIDYIAGMPVYYFPWPEFVTFLDHPHYTTRRRIEAVALRAYDILAAAIGGPGHVIRFPVPIGYMVGGGQSLHCTMAVIGRDSA